MIGRCEADHTDGKPCLAPLTRGRTCPRAELHAQSEEQRYTAALTAAGWALPDPANTRLLVALYVRLQDGKPEPVSPANDTTIDGVPVTLGMRVWDYDLRPVTVVEVEHLDPHTGAWWYRCQRTAGQGPGHMFDAKRMWHRHPSTGRTAP